MQQYLHYFNNKNFLYNWYGDDMERVNIIEIIPIPHTTATLPLCMHTKIFFYLKYDCVKATVVCKFA